MHKTHGFSLVELSIVLVILGLLTGGILTGQNLISAAEMRALLTQREELNTAFLQFRGKYLALPGDMRNASDFGFTVPTGYLGDINGDGNGRVAFCGTSCSWSGPAWTAAINESYMVWRHLELADMVQPQNSILLPSKYDGQNGAYWTISFNPPFAMGSSPFSAGEQIGEFSSHALFLGLGDTVSTINPTFTPETAYYFDGKIDDGLPLSGAVRAFSGSNQNLSGVLNSRGDYVVSLVDGVGAGPAGTSTCVANDRSPMIYNVSVADPRCAIAFKASF